MIYDDEAPSTKFQFDCWSAYQFAHLPRLPIVLVFSRSFLGFSIYRCLGPCAGNIMVHFASCGIEHEGITLLDGDEEINGSIALRRCGVSDLGGIDIPALLVVKPIALLVTQKRWTDIVYLGKWPQPWFANWPPAAWLAQARAEVGQVPADPADMTVATLEGLRRDLQQWAPVLSRDDAEGLEQMRLEGWVNKLKGWTETLRKAEEQSLGGTNRRHSCEFLLQTFLACAALRDKNKLPKTLKHAIDFLPAPLRPLARSAMGVGTGGHCRLPKWSTRLEFIFDVSVMLWRREHMSDDSSCRYGMIDASVQGHRDWLISVIRSVPADSIAEVAAAMARLKLHLDRYGAHILDPRDAEPMDDDSGYDRSADFDIIAKALSVNHSPPVGLMEGKKSLEHKTAAAVFAWWLESGDNLDRFLRSFISLTTDLGVESGVGDFQTIDTALLLPKWVRDAKMYDEMGDVEAEVSKHLFQHVLPVIGLLHICSNAMKQVNTVMEGWSRFYDLLKILEKLVTNPGLLSKFKANCVDGTPFERVGWVLDRRLSALYEKRWGEVHLFCVILKDMLQLLRRTFDVQKMTSNARDESGGGQFDPQKVKAVLDNDWLK